MIEKLLQFHLVIERKGGLERLDQPQLDGEEADAELVSPCKRRFGAVERRVQASPPF